MSSSLYTISSLYQVLSVSFLIMLVGCHSTDKGQSTSEASKNTDQKESTDQNQTSDNHQDANRNIFFSLEKTPCYGKCPVYTFVVYQNGTGVYHGKQFVEKSGKYKTNKLKKEKEAILQHARKIHFFELASKYPQGKKAPSDFSQTKTQLSHGNRSHKVVNKGMGAPEKLRNFEAFADSILKKVNWQKIDSPSND